MGNVKSTNTQLITNYLSIANEITSIADNMLKINTVSSENARSVEEIVAATDHLRIMTEGLNALLQEFHT